jgi:tRNA 2-thiouridine synthesizing protein A
MVVEFDEVLDCSGLLCPMPLVKAKKTLGRMSVGSILKMISTDPLSVTDVEPWTEMTGQELVGWTEEEGKFVFYIRKLK